MIEAEPRRELIGAVGLVGDPRHIIGLAAIQAAVETGIGGGVLGKRVLAEKAIGLTEQRVDETALVELRGILQAVIGAAAAFDAVVA